MNDPEPTKHPEPEFIVEFGEPVYFRSGGCPQCAYESVTVYAASCARCGADFSPWE